MDGIVIQVENGNYIEMHLSDEQAASNYCDACIDYTVYEIDKVLIDGGQMDYSSMAKNYSSITDAIQDVIDFVYNGRKLTYTVTQLTQEDFE